MESPHIDPQELLAILPSQSIPKEQWREIQRVLSLSPRELEVVLTVIDDISNKRIAHVLDISEHTVKSHLVRICTKLKVRDRVGIAGRVLVARELCLSRVAGLDALNGAKKGLRRAVPRTKESWTSRRDMFRERMSPQPR